MSAEWRFWGWSWLAYFCLLTLIDVQAHAKPFDLVRYAVEALLYFGLLFGLRGTIRAMDEVFK